MCARSRTGWHLFLSVQFVLLCCAVCITTTFASHHRALAASTTSAGLTIQVEGTSLERSNAQNVIYDVTVRNMGSTAIQSGNSIVVKNIIMPGLRTVNVVPQRAWRVSATGTTITTFIEATYVGPYPVPAGAALPVISIKGMTASGYSGMVTDASTVELNRTPVGGDLTTVGHDMASTQPDRDCEEQDQLCSSATSGTLCAENEECVQPAMVALSTTAPAPTVCATPTHDDDDTFSPYVATTTRQDCEKHESNEGNPDLALQKTTRNGKQFQVGQQVIFDLTVSNVGQGSVNEEITVTDMIPAGFANLQASGDNWEITLSNTTSPAILRATYTGPRPVWPDQTLSPITVEGTVTNAAPPLLTNLAKVSTPRDKNHSNDTGLTTISISAPPTEHSCPNSPNNSNTSNGNGDSVHESGDMNNNGNGGCPHIAPIIIPKMPATGSDPLARPDYR